jgi:hypothetical protein
MAAFRYSRIAPYAALLVLAAFLAACTRQVPRETLETRHYQVEWEKLDPQRLEQGGLQVEAVPLTPRQWPLEASMKSLFQGDFVGVIDRFDLRFHSSKLEEDVLEDLFDAGFVPVYARISNPGTEPRRFSPDYAALTVDGTTIFFSVPPQALPETFMKVDWGKAGATVVVATLMVVLVVLAASGRNSGNADLSAVARMTGEVAARSPQVVLEAQAGSEPGAPPTSPSMTGLLAQSDLPPGESTEGFLFFLINGPVLDWSTAALRWVGPP